MKVAVLSRNFSRSAGGAESYAVHLAKAMRNECDITVIGQTFDEKDLGFRFIQVPKFPIRIRWLNQLWFNWYSKRVSKRGFDIVHSHENVTHGNVQTIHVKSVHASLKQRAMNAIRIMFSPRLQAYLWIERKRMCTPGHHSVFVSQLLLNETLQVLPNLYRSELIPPGVDLPDRVVNSDDRLAARKVLGLDTDRPVIGFVGHDFKKKGLAALLKALAILPEDVQLLVIGNPSQIADYKELVQTLGPNRPCTFLGVCKNMHLAYSAMDCLAHPTTQDVFPMVILESMAHGIPVVTTMAPFNTMSDLLTNRKNALLLRDPHDHVALAHALHSVLIDEQLVRELVDKGRSFAKRYSWMEIKEAYYKVYRAAISDSES